MSSQTCDAHPVTGFLASLGQRETAALLAGGIVRRFARGQALMHEGQLPDRVLVIR